MRLTARTARRAGLAMFVLTSLLWISACSSGRAIAESVPVEQEPIEFTDVAAQTREFIGYYDSIRLTPQQRRIRDTALEPIPASCCSDNSMRDCCCPCNFAKSVWGLSNHLIAERSYDVQQVREAVLAWIEFINPNGFDGKACYEGRCNTPFAHGGCGGMQALIF